MEKQGKFFINISKGFLIGIGAIIPGLSGGTMAIITGVFEELLEATANLILHIRKSIKVIFPVAFGAVAAILTLSPLLDSFSLNFPVLSNYLFCGIACFSTFLFVRKSITPEFSNKKVLSIILGITTALVISILLKLFQTDFSESGFITLFIIGLPLALALVLPAISFSYMLLFFGLYNKMLESISKFDVMFLIPIASGIIVGTYISSKLLLNLINRYPEYTYSYVLGFVLYSMTDILLK